VPRKFLLLLSLILVGSILLAIPAAAQDKTISVNVLLNKKVSTEILNDLKTYGRVFKVLPELKAVVLLTRQSNLPRIKAKPYVRVASPDKQRTGAPIDTVTVTDFPVGLNTWNLDAINVTQFGTTRRQVPYTGAGVYVAVLDTGLLDSWRQYFPQQRIATQFATAIQGGGAAARGETPFVPNKWQHDQNSHGTHVVSTILGYSFNGTPVAGVAPLSTIIPVKVLNQNGRGWDSAIAAGIVYVTNLKISGALGSAPLVVNMSLGGPDLGALEKAAVDYAVAHHVILVAAAGNEGNAGMEYPGAYAPVISAAAYGWVGEWQLGGDTSRTNFWYADDVNDPTVPSDFYITDFSSRAKAGQDLDVSAPGSWVVGPYQTNSGTNKLSYYFLGGTSMASPHVSGIVALMLQKNHTLVASQAESILEAAASALNMDSGCRSVLDPSGTASNICWGPGHDPASSLSADGAGLITADGALTLTPPSP
jgi:subtilisin family serine protease